MGKGVVKTYEGVAAQSKKSGVASAVVDCIVVIVSELQTRCKNVMK